MHMIQPKKSYMYIDFNLILELSNDYIFLIAWFPIDPIHPDENPQNCIVAPMPVKPRAMTISSNSTDHAAAKIAPPPEWGKPRLKYGSGISALWWLILLKKKNCIMKMS